MVTHVLGELCGVTPTCQIGVFVAFGIAGAKVVHANRGEVVEITGHPGRVYLARCDPTGTFVVTVGSEMCACVWGVEAAAVVVTFSMEGRPANCVEWAPGGRFVAFGLDDGAVAVVDFSSWRPEET
jgi:WD40 repeat protein